MQFMVAQSAKACPCLPELLSAIIDAGFKQVLVGEILNHACAFPRLPALAWKPFFLSGDRTFH